MTYLSDRSFAGCNNLERIYYDGTAEEWETVYASRALEFSEFPDEMIYFYSEAKPEEKGNFWHYVNGEIVDW